MFSPDVVKKKNTKKKTVHRDDNGPSTLRHTDVMRTTNASAHVASPCGTCGRRKITSVEASFRSKRSVSVRSSSSKGSFDVDDVGWNLVERLLARASSRLQRGTTTCLRCKGCGTIDCEQCQGSGLLSQESTRVGSLKRAVEKVGAMLTGSKATGPYRSGSWTKTNRCYRCNGAGKVVCTECGGTGFRGRP